MRNPPPYPVSGASPYGAMATGRPLPRRVSPWWVVGGTLASSAAVFGGLLLYSRHAQASESPPTTDDLRDLPPPPPPGTGGGWLPSLPGDWKWPWSRGKKIMPGTPRAWVPAGGVTPPPGWDPEGNQLYVSPDCDFVLEGKLFDPYYFDEQGGNWNQVVGVEMFPEDGPTLAGTLALEDGKNSVFGFVTYLINEEQYKTPQSIAERVLLEVNPECAAVVVDNRSHALAAWILDFSERLLVWWKEEWEWDENLIDFS